MRGALAGARMLDVHVSYELRVDVSVVSFLIGVAAAMSKWPMCDEGEASGTGPGEPCRFRLTGRTGARLDSGGSSVRRGADRSVRCRGGRGCAQARATDIADASMLEKLILFFNTQ